MCLIVAVTLRTVGNRLEQRLGLGLGFQVDAIDVEHPVAVDEAGAGGHRIRLYVPQLNPPAEAIVDPPVDPPWSSRLAPGGGGGTLVRSTA